MQNPHPDPSPTPDLHDLAARAARWLASQGMSKPLDWPDDKIRQGIYPGGLGSHPVYRLDEVPEFKVFVPDALERAKGLDALRIVTHGSSWAFVPSPDGDVWLVRCNRLDPSSPTSTT